MVLPKPKSEHPGRVSTSNAGMVEFDQPNVFGSPPDATVRKRKLKVPSMKNYGIVSGTNNNNEPV